MSLDCHKQIHRQYIKEISLGDDKAIGQESRATDTQTNRGGLPPIPHVEESTHYKLIGHTTASAPLRHIKKRGFTLQCKTLHIMSGCENNTLRTTGRPVI